MSFETASRDIEKRLEANWATTQIAYENVPFIPPKKESWVELKIFEDDVRRITIGNPGTHRTTGTITITINIPEGSGNRVAKNYAGTLAAIFRDEQFNGITCREARLGTGGTKDGWYSIPLTIAFFWDGLYEI